jgi:23S rRNA (adenine2503-C2)-methyltransferase
LEVQEPFFKKVPGCRRHKMKVTAATGNNDIATVYLAEMAEGKCVEFVESVQPPIHRDEKWVLIVSTLYGCPVGCSICDAGGWYDGKLSTEEIFAQLDYLVTRHYPQKKIPAKKFKIQFARMGEPALNPNVLQVLETLPARYDAPGLMPSISTVAPNGTDDFMEQLIEIKRLHYGAGRFQMQFSIHSTDNAQRDKWIPVKKWSFDKMAEYGNRFFQPGDRKITLNFALSKETRLSTEVLRQYFDPAKFVIKLTPVNPTIRARNNGLVNAVNSDSPTGKPRELEALKNAGYDVILSIGELEENKIGSNCGQYVKRFLENNGTIPEESYQYDVAPV